MNDRLPESAWPTVELDPVSRLRILARVLPGVVLEERVIPASFAEVWSFVSDLERSVPQFDSDVRSLRILRREGERLRVRVVGQLLRVPFPISMDVELRPGWCWMHSRTYLVGMAAVAEEASTRFGHLEGVPLWGPAWLQQALHPLARASRLRHRYHVRHDLDGIERSLGVRP